MKINDIRIIPVFELGIDILQFTSHKYYESNTHLFDLLDSYNNVIKVLYRSVSFGTSIHDYKHNDIAKDIIIRLNELAKKYKIDFILVLSSDKIKQIFI